jgi:hypothetical protein
VVHLDAVLFHHFFEPPMADWIRHIPANCPKDHVPPEVAALELDHHTLATKTVVSKRMPRGSVGQICDRAGDCRV